MTCLLCKAFISPRWRSQTCKRCGAWNVDTANPNMPPFSGIGWVATTASGPARFAYRESQG